MIKKTDSNYTLFQIINTKRERERKKNIFFLDSILISNIIDNKSRRLVLIFLIFLVMESFANLYKSMMGVCLCVNEFNFAFFFIFKCNFQFLFQHLDLNLIFFLVKKRDI